jgi:hypothetical protein
MNVITFLFLLCFSVRIHTKIPDFPLEVFPAENLLDLSSSCELYGPSQEIFHYTHKPKASNVDIEFLILELCDCHLIKKPEDFVLFGSATELGISHYPLFQHAAKDSCYGWVKKANFNYTGGFQISRIFNSPLYSHSLCVGEVKWYLKLREKSRFYLGLKGVNGPTC